MLEVVVCAFRLTGNVARDVPRTPDVNISCIISLGTCVFKRLRACSLCFRSRRSRPAQWPKDQINRYISVREGRVGWAAPDARQGKWGGYRFFGYGKTSSLTCVKPVSCYCALLIACPCLHRGHSHKALLITPVKACVAGVARFAVSALGTIVVFAVFLQSWYLHVGLYPGSVRLIMHCRHQHGHPEKVILQQG